MSEEHEPIVVTDKRRFDPVTGDLRPEPAEVITEARDPVADVDAALTADLHRLSAEYANYLKRVARHRLAVVAMAPA